MLVPPNKEKTRSSEGLPSASANREHQKDFTPLNSKLNLWCRKGVTLFLKAVDYPAENFRIC